MIFFPRAPPPTVKNSFVLGTLHSKALEALSGAWTSQLVKLYASLSVRPSSPRVHPSLCHAGQCAASPRAPLDVKYAWQRLGLFETTAWAQPRPRRRRPRFPVQGGRWAWTLNPIVPNPYIQDPCLDMKEHTLHLPITSQNLNLKP